MNILYFANLREQLGKNEESLDSTQLIGVNTVGDLKQLLGNRGSDWQVIFESTTRVAVNKQLASDDSDISEGDEIAFFPPVTGG